MANAVTSVGTCMEFFSLVQLGVNTSLALSSTTEIRRLYLWREVYSDFCRDSLECWHAAHEFENVLGDKQDPGESDNAPVKAGIAGTGQHNEEH